MSPRAPRVAALLAGGILALTGSPIASGVPSPPRITQIAAGAAHTCAVTSRGGVKCWGDNQYGELGNGSISSTSTGWKWRCNQPAPFPCSTVAVDVAGLTSGIKAIAGGLGHACALTTRGGVKCWGANGRGQLGKTTTSNQAAPIDVTGLRSGVKAIVAGDQHTCALTGAGGVKCWGHNAYGQLGNGSTANSSTPVDVAGLTSGVEAISTVGVDHTCALTDAGGVKCWGLNAEGQLGNGSYAQSNTPVDVVGLTSGVSAISAGGRHACALTATGGVKCWGGNQNGQLGNGSTRGSNTPDDVSGLSSGVAAIVAAQGPFTCALKSGGTMTCWGANNQGQLGNRSSALFSNTPVAVVGLSGIRGITAGNAHTCALTNQGKAKCWGWNGFGQLGSGSSAITSKTPVDVRLTATPAAPAPARRAAPATSALRTFGGRIESYLRESARGRAKLRTALGGVLNCSTPLSTAAAQVASVTANRRGLLARLGTLNAPTAEARRIASLLRQALTHSVAADVRYEAWIRYLQRQPACSTTRNADLAAAQREDKLATGAKQSFVAAYNPLARRLGLRTWTGADF